MKFQELTFGKIRIDDTEYGYDIVIDHGKDSQVQEETIQKLRDGFGHTPLSVVEEIPWKCRRLVIGTGNGALPVMEELRREAQRRKVELTNLPWAGS